MPIRSLGWTPDTEEHIEKTPVFEGFYASQKLGLVRTPKSSIALLDDCLVRDQEETSMCVAFAITGSVYCRLHAIGVPCEPFAPQPLYGLTRMTSRPRKTDPLVDDGSYPFVAMNVGSDFGLCPEKLYPFNPKKVNEEIDLQTVITGSQFRVSSFRRIAARGAARVEICKRAIVAGHPVPLGMMVGDDFQAYTSSKDPVGVETGPECGGHMTFLCGYEDDGEVFIGCNSWSRSWGDHGFYRIHRSKLEHQSTSDLYEMVVSEK